MTRTRSSLFFSTAISSAPSQAFHCDPLRKVIPDGAIVPGVPGPPDRAHRARELQQVGHRLRLVVVRTVGGVPAGVPAVDELVDLVVPIRTVLSGVRIVAARVGRRSLRVAVPLGEPAGAGGVAAEHGAVGIEAERLAAQAVVSSGARDPARVTSRDPQRRRHGLEADTAAVVEVGVGDPDHKVERSSSGRGSTFALQVDGASTHAVVVRVRRHADVHEVVGRERRGRRRSP